MITIFKLINNNLDNDLVFYGLFIGVAGALGYSFARNILRRSYTEKGVQTEGEENLSDSSSEIIPDDVSVSSVETLSPTSTTSTLNPTTSEVGTQTDVTPVNIEVIPNPDTVGRVIDLSNAEYIAAKVEQLNALDPFLATPWTHERVVAMIDTLGIVNNLFN